MTTITTLDELAALGDGSVVTIRDYRGRSQEWQRDGDAFVRSDMRLPTEFFAGAITAGHATVGSIYEERNFYGTAEGANYYIYGIEQVPDGRTRYHFIYSYAGEASESYVDTMLTREAPSFGAKVRSEHWTARMRTVHSLGLTLASQRESIVRLNAQVEELRGQQVEVTTDHAERLRREGMETLATSFREAWDGTSFTEGEVNEVLEGHDLDPLESEETVTVTVEVDAYYELESQDIDRIVGSSNHNVDSMPTLNYTVTWEPWFEMQTGRCACSNVDQEAVEQWMRDEGNAFDSLSYSAECTNC